LIFCFAFLAFCGFGGIVALIVLKSQLSEQQLPTGLMVFFIFLALCLGAPGAVILYGQLTIGGTLLYEDRLEVHFYLWPWRVDTYWLSDIAGIGLFLHRFQMPSGNPQMPTPQTVIRWQGMILSSVDDVSLVVSIETERDTTLSKLSPKTEDDLKDTQAARIVAATYEQALRKQGPGGKLSNPIHLGAAAAAAQAASGSQEATLLASWSPYDGLQMVGPDQSKVDATGLPVVDGGQGGRQSPDSWTYVEALHYKDPKVHALKEELRHEFSLEQSGWSAYLVSMLGPGEVVEAMVGSTGAQLTPPNGEAEEIWHSDYSATLIVTNERVLYLDISPARYLQWRLEDIVFVDPFVSDAARLGRVDVRFSAVDGSTMEVKLNFSKSETVGRMRAVLKGRDNREPVGP
jgi:hypothetical protein